MLKVAGDGATAKHARGSRATAKTIWPVRHRHGRGAVVTIAGVDGMRHLRVGHVVVEGGPRDVLVL
jgi:hypothetical protein